MKIDAETKQVLGTLTYPQVKALDKLREAYVLQWAGTTVKKDNEFETIWALASRESKQLGLVEFMQYLLNPKQ